MNKTQELIDLYRRHKSLLRVAKETGMSQAKAKKILVGVGAYSTPKIKKIREMYSRGYGAEEIAKTLQIGVKAVNAYLPYTKGMYNTDNPTKNAENLRKWRKNKKEEIDQNE